MNDSDTTLSSIPTNIITGFLGVGKTSAILHLLKKKPAGERWAVLVNEFGEIGVDGSLFQGQHTEQDGVFIHEVPGGCMCCAAGLPMQIALNQLLTRAKPDRLLIEPTGLGHPIEVLQVLSAKHYRSVLSLQKIVTLIDARKLGDSRYTEHQTFNQQIAIADLIVGNKLDLYKNSDKIALEKYAKKQGSSNTQLIFTEQGVLELMWLEGQTLAISSEDYHHHHSSQQLTLDDTAMPECGYIKAINQGEGFHSIGWRFSPDFIFERKKLFSLLSGIEAERLKAVFITENTILGYNLTSDALTEWELDDCMESRIEIISNEVNDEWEKQLMSCIVN